MTKCSYRVFQNVIKLGLTGLGICQDTHSIMSEGTGKPRQSERRSLIQFCIVGRFNGANMNFTTTGNQERNLTISEGATWIK